MLTFLQLAIKEEHMGSKKIMSWNTYVVSHLTSIYLASHCGNYSFLTSNFQNRVTTEITSIIHLASPLKLPLYIMWLMFQIKPIDNIWSANTRTKTTGSDAYPRLLVTQNSADHACVASFAVIMHESCAILLFLVHFWAIQIENRDHVQC